MKGHFEAAGTAPRRYLSEVHVDDASNYQLGQEINLEGFSDGGKVHISGVSKGKGFAGVVKRYNFQGGRASHGSHFHRAPGSVGQCASPNRIFKGKKMPGHMGTKQVTVKNLEVIKVDSEQNLLLVKGAIPGGKGAILRVRTA